jgi:gamma-glutamylcyclotransferase (GGCT)/AIG2-like uncharacterized protein YtfP
MPKKPPIMPETVLSPPGAAADAAPKRHVFVYGTLRRGDDNDITRLEPAPQFVGHATIAGTMHHLGTYPGVVLGGEPGGAGRVVGEVYAISAELERQLDEIEEIYPQRRDEYFKRVLPVQVAGTSLDCIVYEINPRYVTDARVLPGGDWVRERNAPPPHA